MKSMLALVLATAACGGSSKPAAEPMPPPPMPEPVAAAEPPPVEAPATAPVAEPAPPPVVAPAPTLPGWYADANWSVAINDDGTAAIENKKKKAKAVKGTWDAAAGTLTIAKKATPIKLDGTKLVFTFAGAEHTVPRQPLSFDGTTFGWKTNEKDFGSLQLNPDNTCIHGTAGTPKMCTYKLASGQLVITYNDKPDKPLTWVIWFDENGKVMHTPKLTLTAAE